MFGSGHTLLQARKNILSGYMSKYNVSFKLPSNMDSVVVYHVKLNYWSPYRIIFLLEIEASKFS